MFSELNSKLEAFARALKGENSITYTIETTANSYVAPYTRIGTYQLSSDEPTPVRLQCYSAAGAPMEVYYHQVLRRIIVCGNTTPLYVTAYISPI